MVKERTSLLHQPGLSVAQSHSHCVSLFHSQVIAHVPPRLP